jgi:hypothetical protein
MHDIPCTPESSKVVDQRRLQAGVIHPKRVLLDGADSGGKANSYYLNR